MSFDFKIGMLVTKEGGFMRKRIFEIIEQAKDGDKWSGVYDIFMMLMIVLSIIPLAFKQTTKVFVIIDVITVVIFVLDYVLRLITADFRINRKTLSFFIYPFTPMAIIDFLSILPSITLLNSGLKLLKIFRLIRTFRVFKALKLARYSKSVSIIISVFKRQSSILYTVATLAVSYVLISALVIFNVEPDSFETFFDAIYWATVSLTTMGYGDIYPVTTAGRIVTMISSIFGIAIIALPSGIITAGFMEELSEQEKNGSNEIEESEKNEETI